MMQLKRLPAIFVVDVVKSVTTSARLEAAKDPVKHRHLNEAGTRSLQRAELAFHRASVIKLIIQRLAVEMITRNEKKLST